MIPNPAPNRRRSSLEIHRYSVVFGVALASKVLKSTPSSTGAVSVPPSSVLIRTIESTNRVDSVRLAKLIPLPAPPQDSTIF